MPFEPLDDHLIRRAEQSFGFPGAPATPPSSPVFSDPSGLFLSEIPDPPLIWTSPCWLWPGRLPLGHLTLLDAAPGTNPSLFALTLAACLTRGNPLPDGTPTLPCNVILYAPYDSASTLKPRLQAAGGDPDHLLLFRPPLPHASRPSNRLPSFTLPRDLSHLATTIRSLHARLVILDPASAIPGLSRCLPALADLAQQTNCAILLIRTLTRPPANPLHPSAPASPLSQAARSHLLLTPDPADQRHHLLITTHHPLCPQPSILTCHLLWSEEDIPRLHWLPERDHASLARLSTGPMYSPHRQAILRFLQDSDTPRNIPDILAATCYDREAGRKMLVRMKEAGELISPARGLYTTPAHPSLASFPTNAPVPVSNVTTSSHTLSQETTVTVPPLAGPTLVSNVTGVPELPSSSDGSPAPPPAPDHAPEDNNLPPQPMPLIEHIIQPLSTDPSSPVPNVTNPPVPEIVIDEEK